MYASYFDEDPPSREAVEVSVLPKNSKCGDICNCNEINEYIKRNTQRQQGIAC